ncbi:MAG TPA: serine/threonine-protein kinase [Kofleriaceae bacterium]|nr:serine/threonine-protein kinase [Kofleriaceae bacterium]
MTPKSQRLGPGTVVADKYRLERVLGRGGMGMVIEAKHVRLGTRVALKFLHRSILGNETVPERFLREARATAGMRSEHVCRVFDVGEFDGTPYLVMELLEGTDLEKVLRRETRLPPQIACNYLIQACAGISEAHAAQIVHRDLKPGNLFLVNRPDGGQLLKVLDFGIAKAPQESELGLTGTNAILGSPAYMSLEQLRSSRLVDTRSDIWSLGVILYELVAGCRPFNGQGVADLALRIAMEEMPKLPENLTFPEITSPGVTSGKGASGKAARVREALDAIIAKCLDRDPDRRYQSVAELALALVPFAEEPERRIASSLGRVSNRPRERVAAADVSPHDVVPDLATTLQTAGAIENPTPSRKPRSRTGLLVAAGALAGGIVAAAVTLRAAPAEDAPAPATVAAAPAAASAEAQPSAPVPPPAAALQPAAAPPQPAPTLQPAAAPVTAPAAPAATITMRFTIEPASAAVEIDGVFVPARQIMVRKDDVPHRLRISAPGYAAQDREVLFDDSQKLVIQLQRAPGGQGRPVARPGERSPRLDSKRLDSKRLEGKQLEGKQLESKSPYE